MASLKRGKKKKKKGLKIESSIEVRLHPYRVLDIHFYQNFEQQINESIKNLREVMLIIGKGEEIKNSLLKRLIESGKVDEDNVRIGIACKMIQKEANRLFRRKWRAISKTQVSNLVKKKNEFIKIPYYSDYIFRSLFSIVDKRKDLVKSNPNLAKLIGNCRRDCFYLGQCMAYQIFINGVNSDDRFREIYEELKDVLLTGSGPLGEKFL